MFPLRALLVFLLIVGVAAAAEPLLTTMRIEPITAEPGESHVITVEADCSENGCSAVDITMSFDPAILHIDDLVIGPVLGEDVYFVHNENFVDNLNGRLRLVATALGDPPLTDSTNLLEIHVTMLKPGTTELIIEAVDLGDMAGNPVEVEFVPSTVEVVEAAPVTVTCEYTIRVGDTLRGIAIGNNVTVPALRELNGIPETSNLIVTGNTLLVPAAECLPGVGGNSNIIEVHDCRHLGGNVFEWYSVRRQYNAAGNISGHTRIGGPFTGGWTPGCPAGERPQAPSDDDDDGGSRSSGSSGGAHPSPEPDDDDNGGGGGGGVYEPPPCNSCGGVISG